MTGFYAPPHGIGHNQGPPLEVGSWTGYCWHRAKRQAMSHPPIEVVRSRKRRAEELGLTYRQYAAILMDKGTRTDALVFDVTEVPPPSRASPIDEMAKKLKTLKNCTVLAATAGRPDVIDALNDRTDGLISDWARYPSKGRHQADTGVPPWEGAGAETLLRPVLAMLGRHRLVPSATVMVGDGIRAETIYHTQRLARVFPSGHYFR